MKILTVPNKKLHQQATPVEVFGPKLQSLIDKMFITMYRAKGIGLAANQVGVLKQVIVLNMRYSPMVLINPTIHPFTASNFPYRKDDLVWEEESCLSIPGYSKSIGRLMNVCVMSYTRYGKKQNFFANNLLARCIQHECQHLKGKLINDNAQNV